MDELSPNNQALIPALTGQKPPEDKSSFWPSVGGAALGIIPLLVAKRLGVKNLPTSERFTRAVGNTPGAAIEDGSLVMNQNRMGPLTLEARTRFLERLLNIQREINGEADRLKRPRVDHLNSEEETRIRELIAAETWPRGWDGSEPLASEPFEESFADGSKQPLLFGMGDE